VATFSEQLRCGAPEAIGWLQQQGYDPAVLSGDRAARASVVGRALQIAVVDGQSPADKAEALAALARRGHRVAMVGDGINDAPALATACVGVSLADGADLARETAGVCLLGDDLRRLPEALVLARRTVRVVRQNLFWALFYNVVGIGFAVAGWLNPVVAAAAMVASSALVLANSLRLRGDDSTPRAGAREPSTSREAPGRTMRRGTTPLATCPDLAEADHPLEAHA
jgi:Cu+-exporting ATPase